MDGTGGVRNRWQPELLRAARSDCTLLITGETGSGKGHLAEHLHAASRRATRAFVPVNCGAIPADLVDSHLFGHERGSFTGASQAHAGMVRAADGGTLFLDEVGELPLPAQTRLLRLLDNREIHPVGASRPVGVNVRIIAATNVDLDAAVSDGRFRDDLFFRLEVIRIEVPPLRDRRSDIPGFLDEFLNEFSTTYDRRLVLSPDARRTLVGHDWPGNIRQLRSVLERLFVLCPCDLVSANELREFGRVGTRPPGRHRPCPRKIRGDLASRTLAACNGSVREAAAHLGVHRSTLYRWLRP